MAQPIRASGKDHLRARVAVQKLGKNITGYLGERVEISSVLGDCVTSARTHGWSVEEIPVPRKPSLLAFNRSAPCPGNRRSNHPEDIYISAGIHGDEPAGPLALRQLLQEDRWPPGANLWICPCLNPTGFQLNQRENAEGFDLNRQYLQPESEETKAHIAWLKRQPAFDLCFCLHEDWESHGFYLYELNPDDQPSRAGEIISRVAEVCPIDESELIEGRPAKNGIIHPSVDPRSRPQWPEAFFLLTNKTRLSYTLEAPSDFALGVRVAALVEGVRGGVDGTD